MGSVSGPRAVRTVAVKSQPRALVTAAQHQLSALAADSVAEPWTPQRERDQRSRENVLRLCGGTRPLGQRPPAATHLEQTDPLASPQDRTGLAAVWVHTVGSPRAPATACPHPTPHPQLYTQLRSWHCGCPGPRRSHGGAPRGHRHLTSISPPSPSGGLTGVASGGGKQASVFLLCLLQLPVPSTPSSLGPVLALGAGGN